jgi:hypothetical protein
LRFRISSKSPAQTYRQRRLHDCSQDYGSIDVRVASRDIAGMLIAMHKTTCRIRLAALCDARRNITTRSGQSALTQQAGQRARSTGRNVERLQMTPSIGDSGPARTKPTKPNQPAGKVPLFSGPSFSCPSGSEAIGSPRRLPAEDSASPRHRRRRY